MSLHSARTKLVSLYRSLVGHTPPRVRNRLRVVWEAALNLAPGPLFAVSRRRFERRLARGGSFEPPLLLRLAAFRRRIPPQIPSFAILDRPDLSLANVDSVSTRVIYWTGSDWVARHSAGLDLWQRLCERARSVIEVGANVGYYTIAGGGLAADYTAYEPHPRSHAALQRNLALNGLDGVRVIEAAAVPGSGTTTVELICPTGNDRGTPSGAMVRGSDLESDVADRGTETFVVPAVPFDQAIAGGDLVKIDVEGLEGPLLLSAWDRIVAERPMLMLEVHERNVELRAMLPRLAAELDATTYAMRSEHLVAITDALLEHGPLGSATQTWDFLIVPAARAEMIDGLVRTHPAG